MPMLPFGGKPPSMKPFFNAWTYVAGMPGMKASTPRAKSRLS